MVISEPQAQIMLYTHTHEGVTGRTEAKRLLSPQRQSDYNHLMFDHGSRRVIDCSFRNLSICPNAIQSPWDKGNVSLNIVHHIFTIKYISCA